MKKIVMLLVAVTLLSSTLGCGCCRRLRDRLCRGAFCGSSAATVPTYIAPAPTPTFVPQYTQATAPMYACPPTQVENCYPVEAGCSYDPGCNYDTGYGSSPTLAPMTIPSGTIDPGPATN